MAEPPCYGQETNSGVKKITDLYWKAYTQTAASFAKQREIAKLNFEKELERIAEDEKKTIKALDDSMMEAVAQRVDILSHNWSWLYFWK